MKPNLIRGEAGKFAKVEIDPASSTKTCSTCKVEKPIDLFGNERTSLLGKKSRCKKCESVASMAYARRHPERTKARIRRATLKRYGLTPQEYDDLFASQGFACAMCGATKSGGKSPVFPVDHCHTSGEVRAILCNMCNLLLGHANDDVGVLKNAIEYLERHRG